MHISNLFKTGLSMIGLSIASIALANPAGTVTFKSGEATIIHADKTSVAAEKNTALNAGDTIETREGRLQLELIDGGKVSLQPNTIYKINKYEFSGKEDGSEYAFTELIKGGLRTISGLVGHKNRDRYQLKTAVATIGIRGTEFTVNFNNNQLLMTTNHGSVDVCNKGGCLNAGTGQTIAVNGLGASPKPSNEQAKAAVAAPVISKPVFAASDSVSENGLPSSIVDNNTQPGTSNTSVTTATGGTPVATAPNVTVPNVATPTVTAPVVSVPAVTTPVVIAPAVTTPAVVTPVVTTPVVTTPVVTAPTVTAPVVTSPVTVPVVTTPVVATPVVTAPVVTAPTIVLPVVANPVSLPIVATPVVATPVVTTPVVATPVITLPIINLPIITLPAVAHPTSLPAVARPVVSVPVL